MPLFWKEEDFQFPRFRPLSLNGCEYRVVSCKVESEFSDEQLEIEAQEEAEICEMRNLDCAEEGIETTASIVRIVEGEFAGQYIHKRRILSELARFVIGKHRATIKEFRTKYNVIISVEDEMDGLEGKQRKGGETCVSVIGERFAVAKAVASLNSLLIASYEKLPYTHFVSFPLLDENFQRGFSTIENLIRSKFPHLAKFLTKQRHFHFSVVVLRLFTDEMVQKCADVLAASESEIHTIFSDGPPVVALQGLGTFDEDHTSAKVVYASTGMADAGKGLEDGSFRSKVNALGNVLFPRFVEAGVVTWKELHKARVLDTSGTMASINLHATVLNSKYGHEGGQSHQTTMDVEQLLQESNPTHFGTSLSAGRSTPNFGTGKVSALHLSQMGTNDTDGYYHCVLPISLEKKSTDP